MKKNLFTLIVWLLLIGVDHVFAQGVKNIQTATLDTIINKTRTIKLDTKKYDNYESRVHLIYQLYRKSNVDLSLDKENGVFNVNFTNDTISNINEYVTNIYNKILEQYAITSKDSICELFNQYKKILPIEYTNHILKPSYTTRSTTNNLAVNAFPFCTDNGQYNFPAGVNAGTGEDGPNYNCLLTQPNPAWYYMKIDNPGDINIYMYSTPLVDIDFCCWGPFSDPITPCPYGLTQNKVVSCSFSADPTETCVIPSQAQSGEYYILLITNYSNESCNISFEKVSGSGTTDCSIMPPMIESNSPLCIGDTLFLSAQDTYNATYSWIGPDGWTSNLRTPYRPNVTREMEGEYSCCISIENQTSEPMLTKVSIGCPYDTLIFDTICQWDSYLQNGFVLDSMPAGNYFDTLFLNTVLGCDSIVKLNLTVTPIYDTLIIDTICEGKDYMDYNFNIINPSAGVHNKTQNLSTIYGCDSIVRLNLTVNPTYDTTITESICEGDSYTENGFIFENKPVGNYFDTLFLNTVLGCDSIVKLNLTVTPIYDTLIIDTICEGEDYMDYNFNIINPSAGVHNKTQNLSTIYGCDSIVRLNLTVNPSYDTLITDTICEGEDYMDYNFNIINPSVGVHNKTQNLSTIYGCDSIVRLNLTVNPIYDITITESICEGESYTENGFIFENKPVGNYFDTLFLSTIYGCDSIVKLQLTINKTYRFDIYDSICEGDDYNMYGLNIINPNVGIYEYMSNLHTTNGCDSIYNIDLKVINKYEDIVIEGIEEISVATNLSTGCYKYTIGEVENHEHYTWEIDNEEWKIIPDNNECIVCATTPDKGTLYVRAENYCGSVYDYIVLNAKFIEDQDNADVRIYPNPITDFVNIQQNDITCINVYDSFGQIVIGNNYNFDNQVTLDLSNLRSSIYIIEIITLEQTFVERIYIKK